MKGIFDLGGKQAPVNSHGARSKGDLARDNREWEKAEEFYAIHLATRPNDAAIWVQLGHALKEQAKLPAAVDAYRRALELEPDDADAHLQLGHALKLQGKRSEAGKSYARSYELMPSRAAFEELSAILGAQRANERFQLAGSSSSVDRTYFEIDDLLGWLRDHKTLSGIQRVAVGIIRNILAEVLVHDEGKYAFVRNRDDRGFLWQLWPRDLNDIIEYATSAEVERGRLTLLLDRAEQGAVEAKPSSRDCYFILGAFWAFNGDATRYARLKRAGVSIGVYVYDLIPLTHPEFCDAHLVSDFRLSLGDGMAMFDFVLTISEFTAREVRRTQKELDLRHVPVEVVPLAHLLNEEPPEKEDSTWTPNIVELRDRDFVLSVSTIEARKNHAYLVAAWRLFLEQGLDPPDLVFVGRYGWRVNDLMEQLQATDFLDGRIHVLHDLSDGELQTLYRHCQFTVFPSFVEGWGLPVGESLAYGRPCVASNRSSIPEVGGDLVDYFDPYDLRGGMEVLRRMAFDAEYRAKREADVRSGFVGRTWTEVSSNLLAQIQRLRHVPRGTTAGPLLRPGELFFPGELRLGQVIPLNYPTRPLRTILAESWFTPEPIGAWMRGSRGRLWFRTEYGAGTEVAVYLSLIGAPWAVNQTLHIAINGADSNEEAYVSAASKQSVYEPYPRAVFSDRGSTVSRILSKKFLRRVTGRTSAGGVVEVQIEVQGKALPLPPGENRKLSVGVAGVAYADPADTDLRLNIEEALREN
jgi:glycosyltransferase involved in cell wall biosynthesis